MSRFFNEKKFDKACEQFDALVKARGVKLAPATGLRMISRTSCASCKYIEYDGYGGGQCVRPNGRWFSSQDLEEYEYICDRYKKGYN